MPRPQLGGAGPGADPEPRIGSTRDRLLAAGLALFAARGFHATTVGQIEAAAGLVPRRGTLYRHFPSKRALLEAAVRRQLASVSQIRDTLARLPPGDPHTEALMLGRIVLDTLTAERQLIDTFEREGDQLPELRDLYRTQITDPSYQAMAHALTRWANHLRPRRRSATALPSGSLPAVAVLALGALINVHRSAHTFGATPLALTDDQILQAWADLCLALAHQLQGAAP